MESPGLAAFTPVPGISAMITQVLFPQGKKTFVRYINVILIADKEKRAIICHINITVKMKESAVPF